MKFEEPNHYIADEGKVFIRIIDEFNMGSNMYLYKFIDGTDDKIENYREEVGEEPLNSILNNNEETDLPAFPEE